MTKQRKPNTTGGRGAVDLVVVFGDTHTNSTRGLRPPRFFDQEREEYRHAPKRIVADLWEPWLANWKAVKKEKKRLRKEGYTVRVIAVFNGDGPDRNYHDREGYEMLSPNRAVILDLCEAMLEPALKPGLVDLWVFNRGTPAHDGGSSELMELLAERVSRDAVLWRPDENSAYSHYWPMLDIQGVPILFGHHPPAGSKLYHTRRHAAARTATHLWSGYNMPVVHMNKPTTYERQPFPVLAMFGHVHYYADSGADAVNPIRLVFGPSWQLPTAFIHRIGRGMIPNEVGAVWVRCHDGEYDLVPWLHTPRAAGPVTV
jgi:hypothetical protein